VRRTSGNALHFVVLLGIVSGGYVSNKLLFSVLDLNERQVLVGLTGLVDEGLTQATSSKTNTSVSSTLRIIFSLPYR